MMLIAILLLGFPIIFTYALCSASQKADMQLDQCWEERKALMVSGQEQSAEKENLFPECRTVELNQLCTEFIQQYFSSEREIGDSILVSIEGVGMCYIQKVSD